MSCKQLSSIVEFFHSERYKKEDWKDIFNDIAAVCDADRTYLTRINSDSFIPDRYKRYFEVESKQSITYLTTKGRKTVEVADYTKHPNSSIACVNEGIKSLIAVPIVFAQETFGALEVVHINNNKPFSSDSIHILNIIASVIGMVLHKEKTENHYQDIIETNTKILEIIYSVGFPKGYKDNNFIDWIKENFIKLSKITNCDAIGMAFKDESIYATYFKDNNTCDLNFDINEKIKDLIAYKMCDQNTTKVLMHNELEKAGIKPSKPLNIVGSALFVPVVIENRTIAAFGFGFKSKNHITKHHQIILRSFAYYLIFSIIASKHVSKAYTTLSETESKFIDSIVLMMEARDIYTKGHSQRVAYYAQKIAQAINLPSKDQNDVYIAGILHDIGKIGIPDNVLLKPGYLTANEFKIMQYHPVFSYQIIKDINKFKGKISEYVKYHHERCDKTGYPEGLSCKDIPIGAKILAIADVFDAITTTRPYRKAMDIDSAIELILNPINGLDLDIVEKSIDTLKNSFFIEESNIERQFVPKEIDELRESIFTTDYTTGLSRRKQFIENVNKLILNQEQFNVFLVDIINLDYINFKYSMDMGDKIISYTAKSLSKIDSITYLSRISSDSFFFISKTLQNEDIESIKTSVKKHILEYLRNDKSINNLTELSSVIDFYITLSTFDIKKHKNAEDLIYECIHNKKTERILFYKDRLTNIS